MTDPTQDPENENGAPEDMDSDWAAALSEQAASEQKGGTQADGLKDEMDDWAAALAEQTASTQTGAAAEPAETTVDNSPHQSAEADSPQAGSAIAAASQEVFRPLVGEGAAGNSDIDLIMDIPVQLSVELGRTKLTIKNILQLGQGSVVELDGLAGEPMDIFVNGYLIAQGEVVVVDDKYGIRLTDIITPSDRLHRLNSRR
jgi:flagellar motor switch protein FliN/FliY